MRDEHCAPRSDGYPGRVPLAGFHEATRAWFTATFGEPSEVQRAAWPAIRRGGDALIAAPTGSGKTLAAFLWAIDQLVRESIERPLPDETRILYVSPLKALGNDIERNLQLPLRGIQEAVRARGLPEGAIRTAVRSGDTPAFRRAELAKRPPHVLVTTPESFYILLTSESGRNALRTVRTVIVDEVHALVQNKRGAHLALSLERLDALAGRRVARIGLSATQSPIAEVMRFLVGASDARQANCAVVDQGHRRGMRLSLELPRSPLEAVMSGEVWEEIYERLAQLIRERKTTLVFVNTRRQCERVARHLAERLGDERVTAHHGSLSREHRLRAEQRLKSGELGALVATASLELGIDVGAVELVCQLGSTRSIAGLLQRVGRSGHFKGGVPDGRVFPLSRDDLVECAALVRAAKGGDLDRVAIPTGALDILAQQVVAMSACETWDENALFAHARRAHPYRDLARDEFDAVVRMLADGFETARGRRGALVHHDRVNGRVRGRRAARLVAITSGGAIPDTADYKVVLDPAGVTVGTLNEDFAIESMSGDIFQLGNTSYRILRVETGVVRVEDAKGAPPSLPFWLGEAPARTWELSRQVSALREGAEALLARVGGDDDHAPHALADWIAREIGLGPEGAQELAGYLASAHAALGALPTFTHVIVERFFDEAGGMQLVVHAPFGGRVNRAWGLALRKRFCRSFNFELQAAATEDAIVLSLGPTHSFPLDDIRGFLRTANLREVLVQALLAAPMFETRWRWNAGRALAVPRMGGGKKTPAALLRMRAADLLTVAFPEQQACAENLQGDRVVPDHPLVRQTIDDCLHEAMDVERLMDVLGAIERGEIAMSFRDLTEPSPLAQEILNARPYAFLDDAPLEERRTRAVMSRRYLDAETARSLGALDPAAIERVRDEALPACTNADELHDALALVGFLSAEDAARIGADDAAFEALVAQRRAARMVSDGANPVWIAAERVPELRAAYPDARFLPAIEAPRVDRERRPDRDAAVLALARGRLDVAGPMTASGLADATRLDLASVTMALHALEAEGSVLRGAFTPNLGPTAEVEWCERRLLARIHRYTLDRLRREIEPVAPTEFVRFLFDWHHADGAEPYRGAGGLLLAIERLAGYAAPAVSWEADILPARVQDYDPEWLDQLCLSGAVAWSRAGAPEHGTARRPLRTTPIALAPRELAAALAAPAPRTDDLGLSHPALLVRDALRARGASFFDDLIRGTKLLASQVEDALSELAASGLVASDAYAGLRALLTPPRSRQARAAGRRPSRVQDPMARAGRWSPLAGAPESADATAAWSREHVEAFARVLLGRWGVVFRKLLDRESGAPPWRDLLQVYRRLEAQGELRGGRFVEGFSGEQFALPDAVARLRALRRAEPTGALITVSAADPLALVGIVVPGERVAATAHNRLLFRDGTLVAVLAQGEVHHLDGPEPKARWNAELALRKRQLPAGVRAYLGTRL
jgi:ATP-dependent Lhr-like helicase